MTIPGPTAGLPGELDYVSPSDVIGLVLHPGSHHLGFPPGVAIDFPTSTLPAPRLLTGGQRLTPGDRYLFPLDTLLTHLAGVPGYVPDLVRVLLEDLGKLAAADALQLVGLTPLAWTVPTTGGPVMPAGAHTRMIFTGVFGSAAAPAEIWCWGINAASVTAAQTGPDLLAAAQAMHASYVANVKAIMSNVVVLTQCLYAKVGADGHVLRFPDGAYQQGKLTVNEPGGTTGKGTLPLQTALVCTFTTARPGASGRGRAFLPLQDASAMDTDFRLVDLICQNTATRMGHLVFDLNAITAGCGVVSGKGYISPITGTKVGKVPDTMRTRRDKLTEGYLAGSISAG